MRGLVFLRIPSCARHGPFSHQKQTLDVDRIVSITTRRRLFCIKDRLYPISCVIDYEEPTSGCSFDPVITTGGIFYVFTSNPNVIETINLRFHSQQQADSFIQQISIARAQIARVKDRLLREDVNAFPPKTVA